MGFITFLYCQIDPQNSDRTKTSRSHWNLETKTVVFMLVDLIHLLTFKPPKLVKATKKRRSFARYLNIKLLNLTFNLYIFSAWKYLFRDGTEQSKVVGSLQVLLALNLILFTISSYLL